jgi:hypothetical protein
MDGELRRLLVYGSACHLVIIDILVIIQLLKYYAIKRDQVVPQGFPYVRSLVRRKNRERLPKGRMVFKKVWATLLRLRVRPPLVSMTAAVHFLIWSFLQRGYILCCTDSDCPAASTMLPAPNLQLMHAFGKCRQQTH